MKIFAIAMGLSALLAAPATAATMYDARATATISNLALSFTTGMTVTYTSTIVSNATATGSAGAVANAGNASAVPPPGPAPFTFGSDVTFGANANGVTPSSPNADTAASSAFAQSITLTFTNTVDTPVLATFDVVFSLFVMAQSDGLAGETSTARVIVEFTRNGVTQLQQIFTRERLLGESGIDSVTVAPQPFRPFIGVEGGATGTYTISLRAEGSAVAAAAVTPIPLPASAPLLAAALLGAGALLRRRRAA